MALQIEYTSEQFGLSAPTAYAKIEDFNGNVHTVNFNVFIYSDQSARAEGNQPIGYFNFSVPFSDNMTYTAVYDYLKTIPGFENGINV